MLQNNLQKCRGPCVSKKCEIFKFTEKSIDHREGLAPHDHWCRRTCMRDWAVEIGFPPTGLFPPAEFVWDDLTCHAAPPPPHSGRHLWRMLCLINGSAVMSSRQSGCQRSRCLRNLHSAPSFQSGKNTTFCKCFLTSSEGQSGGTKFIIWFRLCRFRWRWTAVWF